MKIETGTTTQKIVREQQSSRHPQHHQEIFNQAQINPSTYHGQVSDPGSSKANGKLPLQKECGAHRDHHTQWDDIDAVRGKPVWGSEEGEDVPEQRVLEAPRLEDDDPAKKWQRT